MVRQDIVNRGLQKRAVVSVSWGTNLFPDGRVPNWILFDHVPSQQRIMNDLDVPIVYLSGNKAGISGRRDIDQYPARLANDEDFPYINVGSVNFVGTRSYFSQGGDLLTVSAVGQDVTCASVQGTGSRRGSGTSYAAPQVAGLLAYFMSQETVPFDTTTGSLVKNAKAFLKDTASWSRPGNNKPKVAWNLINSADNPPSS